MNDLSLTLQQLWKDMQPKAPEVPSAPVTVVPVVPVVTPGVDPVAGFYTRLVHQTDGHNKEYILFIERATGNQFVVSCKYGRIGGSLQTTTKTDEPVGFAEAKVIYHRTLREKLDKGYKET